MKSLLCSLLALTALLTAAPGQTLITPLKNPALSGTLDVSGLSAKTGTGNLVLATSPTLVTPVLGVATATSLNGLTLTSSTGTITLASSKTLTVSQSVTLTSDGTGTRTLNIAAGGTLGTAAFTATSAYVATPAGTTGTGNLVYATSPTLVTPALGAATATSLTASAGLTAVNVTSTGTAVLAGIRHGLTAQTSNYTIARTDYLINATSGTWTATLPSAIGFGGEIHVVKNSGAGTITLGTSSSQTIDGVTTKSIAAGAFRRVISDGANWLEL